LEARGPCPLHIGRLMYTYGRRIYGLSILVGIERYETVHEVLDVFERFKVRPIQIFGSTPILAKTGWLTYIIGDFTDSKVSPQDLVVELEKLEGIKQVHIIKPIDDLLLIDTVHFPLFLGKDRAMVFTRSFFDAVIRKTRNKFGEGVEAFQYYEGRFIGEEIYEKLRSLLTEKGELLRAFKAFLIALGLALIEVTEFKPEEGTIVVRAYENFECEIGKEEGKAYSHLLRGILAGFFSKVLDEKLIAYEVRCIAKGDDYCEFILTKESV